MEICKLSLEATTPGSHIGLQIRLDGRVIFDSYEALDHHAFEHEFTDSANAQHVLEIEMMGKLPSDTEIDSQGQILSDRAITIENMAFDDIELGQLVIDSATYTHDFNGSQDTIQDQFYGSLGCNGIVRIEFSSPVYLWMLENM